VCFRHSDDNREITDSHRPQRQARQDQRKYAQTTAFDDKLEEIAALSGAHISLEFDAGRMVRLLSVVRDMPLK